MLPVLERIERDDIDVESYAVSKLEIRASKNKKNVECEFENKRSVVVCIIKADGMEEVRETEMSRGESSQQEDKFAAAERAMRSGQVSTC